MLTLLLALSMITPTLRADELTQARELLHRRYQVHGPALQVSATELARQNALGSKTDFLSALDSAMQIFLGSTQDTECPLSIELESVGFAIPGVDLGSTLPIDRQRDRAIGALLAELNQPETIIDLVALDDAPEGYEVGYVNDHWVFQLHLPGSEHGFWAVVSRDGSSAPFCYGFN
jgi:hypothetical protein